MSDDDALLACARRWLEAALTVRGLGGKTAAGYGWFSIRHDVLERLLANAKAEDLRRKEREEAATVEPSPEIIEKFALMKEQDLSAALNKYAYGPTYWPKDTSLVYEVTLYDFIKTRMGQLAETKNGKKAMSFLAQKLDRPL